MAARSLVRLPDAKSVVKKFMTTLAKYIWMMKAIISTPLNVLVDIMESEKSKTEKFIELFGADKRYLNGLCYWFAYILKGRFSDGDIWYDPILNHFYFVWNDTAYDVRGRVELPKTSIKWNEYQEFDSSDYERVVKYCILKEGE